MRCSPPAGISARRYARSPEHELELCDWTDELFAHPGFDETPAERRLRHAACLLADIGWRAHPDYRAERSLGMISQAAFVDIDHPGRVFLALTVFYRYEGEEGEGASEGLSRLVDDRMLERAQVLSEVFRLAYILTAAMPGVLPKLALRVDSNKMLTLKIPTQVHRLAGRAGGKAPAVARRADRPHRADRSRALVTPRLTKYLR